MPQKVSLIQRIFNQQDYILNREELFNKIQNNNYTSFSFFPKGESIVTKKQDVIDYINNNFPKTKGIKDFRAIHYRTKGNLKENNAEHYLLEEGNISSKNPERTKWDGKYTGLVCFLETSN